MFALTQVASRAYLLRGTRMKMISSEGVSSLVKRLDDVPNAASVQDDLERLHLIEAAKSLVVRVEKPWESFFRIV